MNKRILTGAASVLALLCSTPALADDHNETDMAQESETPTMTFGTWGVDPSLLDQSVDPGDNFFEYVNGKWVAANVLPGEYGRFGAFNVLGEKSRSDVRALIDELVASNPAPGSAEARIVDSYNAYLDTAAIDAAGMAPAQRYLGEIYGAENLEELARLFPQAGYPGLISMGVTVDSKNPDSYVVSTGFSGMGLPDRDYYLVDNEQNTKIRAAYMDYLTFLLDQAGYDDPAQVAQTVYAFERDVAELEWDRTAIRNSDLTYNKLSKAELMQLSGDFPIAALMQQTGFDDQDTFLMSQLPPTDEELAAAGIDPADAPGMIGGGTPAMMKLLTETPLATIKAYMATRFLSDNASVLPSEIDQAKFNFYGKTLSGTEMQEPRWKRAIGNTQGELGEVLGKLYVERYFPEESKAAMDDLVKNLRVAMRESIAQNDWMTEETKEQAYAKLDSFNPKIGYPDEFETYEGLAISGDDPLANRIAATQWQIEDNRSKLGTNVDKTEWFMLPQTVNAYYNPVFNEIVFPAAILQQPFFGPNADPAVNYGGIGAVIGHEMGHGFDDQGAKYDATGTLRNWWAESDLEKFTELGNMLAEQYDSYCPYDEGETCVNGRFTLGENIGDVGGLSMAYRAYRLSLDGKEAPVIDGLTGDQRFFLAWAQVWRSMQREETGRQRLLTDPHSPETYRVNGAVRNHDAWYKAFNVTPDDELYLPPEERVSIW
ncbi:M13 family peptidase [Altererythrobacter aurantiacus]|uniref:M13 family peptidase n=1 Tax=Parapontixanthobacter aurantiacus TaxID=1463599 RepID=A0A844ZIE7_9SPHN|nr:M13 family metallopeptidase [Parapontixanthobacter aurantiacus]MXO86707.1 M13 family peptidase [Parapontixanthobacter aurantiacus]